VARPSHTTVVWSLAAGDAIVPRPTGAEVENRKIRPGPRGTSRRRAGEPDSPAVGFWLEATAGCAPPLRLYRWALPMWVHGTSRRWAAFFSHE
jgi:hypothetical protein